MSKKRRLKKLRTDRKYRQKILSKRKKEKRNKRRKEMLNIKNETDNLDY